MARTLVDYLSFCYSLPRRGGNNNCNFAYRSPYVQRKGIENTHAFSHFFKANLEGDSLEIPCAYRFAIEDYLKKNISCPPEEVVNTLYIPMFYLEEGLQENKTSLGLIKKFFDETPGIINLRKERSSACNYIGGRGLIMYEDFTPLIMFGLKIEKDNTSLSHKYKVVRPILRINPIIYSKNDILAKYIRTKLIEGCFSLRDLTVTSFSYYGGLSDYNNFYSNTTHNYDFQIIIEDFSYFFAIPNIPDGSFNSDDVNAMLEKEVVL